MKIQIKDLINIDINIRLIDIYGDDDLEEFIEIPFSENIVNDFLKKKIYPDNFNEMIKLCDYLNVDDTKSFLYDNLMMSKCSKKRKYSLTEDNMDKGIEIYSFMKENGRIEMKEIVKSGHLRFLKWALKNKYSSLNLVKYASIYGKLNILEFLYDNENFRREFNQTNFNFSLENGNYECCIYFEKVKVGRYLVHNKSIHKCLEYYCNNNDIKKDNEILNCVKKYTSRDVLKDVLLDYGFYNHLICEFSKSIERKNDSTFFKYVLGEYSEYDYLVERFIREVANESIKNKNMIVFKFIIDSLIIMFFENEKQVLNNWYDEISIKAATNNNLEVLKYLKSLDYNFSCKTIINCSFDKNVECFNYCLEVGCPLTGSALTINDIYSNIYKSDDPVKFLHYIYKKTSIVPSTNTYNLALLRGDLGMMVTLRMLKVPIDESIRKKFYLAAGSSYKALKYIKEKDKKILELKKEISELENRNKRRKIEI
jgi:hypothetical protein